MPILIDTNYKYVNDLLSKNNGVYISPDEYERYGYTASLEMFDDFTGIKTIPKITYGKNRLVDSRLNPFKKRVNLSFSGEYLDKPTNLKYITAVYTSELLPTPIKPIDEDRYAMIFRNPLTSPSDDDIYYIEEATKLRLLGNENLAVWVEYLERPSPIKWNYTIVNGRPVYNPTGSVNYQWDVSETQELTNRILLKAGMSMKDIMAIQVAGNSIAQE